MIRLSSLLSSIAFLILILFCIPKILGGYIIFKEKKLIDIDSINSKVAFITPSNGKYFSLILRSSDINISGNLFIFSKDRKESIFFSKETNVVSITHEKNSTLYNHIITENKKTGREIFLEKDVLYILNIKLNKYPREKVSVWIRYLCHI